METNEYAVGRAEVAKENKTESQQGETNKTDETTRAFRGDKIKDDKIT
jgi:hypothetical protein